MIDIKELRIGNWVDFLGYPVQIIGISARIRPDVGYVEIPGYDHPHKGIHFKPIPLTGNWLCGFGWGYNERTNSYENQDARMHLEHITRNDSYRMFNYILKSLIADRIFYVHQLQNIHFCLTGQELTLKP